MYKQQIQRVATLRFHRWSRRASAVFHSLGAVVLIGRLSKSVLLSLGHKLGDSSCRMALQLDDAEACSRPYIAEQDVDDEEDLALISRGFVVMYPLPKCIYQTVFILYIGYLYS